jgi:hypothetical protein
MSIPPLIASNWQEATLLTELELACSPFSSVNMYLHSALCICVLIVCDDLFTLFILLCCVVRRLAEL